MTKLKVLKQLDQLFSSKEKWTKRHFALDQYNQPVAINNPSAVCWCLSGGLRRLVSDKSERHVIYNILVNQINKLVKRRKTRHHFTLISEFNDNAHTRFSSIKSVIRNAIKEVEKEAS